MKALRFLSKGKISLEEVVKPDIGPEEVLLRIHSVGICGTDLHIFNGGMKVPQGTILGHEFSGVVELVGDKVKHLQPGTHAVAEHVLFCRRCRYCLRGRPNLCIEARVLGVHSPGALAEYLALPAELVHPVPNSMDLEEAALIEPLSIALYAVREAGFLLGRKVAVVGQGPIGLLVDQVLRQAGAQITGIDIRESALSFAAERSWVDQTLNPQDPQFSMKARDWTGDGFDAVFEVVGKEETAELSLEIARRGGSVFVLGVFESPARLDLMQIVKKELRVSGSYTCAFSFPEAIELAAQGRVDLRSLITHVYSVVEGAKAFEESGHYEGRRIKSLIRF